jgi:hypothetical protein
LNSKFEYSKIEYSVFQPKRWISPPWLAAADTIMINQQSVYDEHFQAYRELFGPMSSSARAIWFFAADETEVLSFHVGQGEAVEEASSRHGIKLGAMADALESLPDADAQHSVIASLRRLAVGHGWQPAADQTPSGSDPPQRGQPGPKT